MITRPFSVQHSAFSIQKLCILASLPAIILAARVFPWDTLPAICIFNHVTGLPCPTCGMTRSMESLTHLDFRRAMLFNPLLPLFMGIFILWWVLSVYQMATGRQVRLLKWANVHISLVAITGTAVLFIFGVMRILLLVHAAR